MCIRDSIHTGATPVFADIDYRTGCIDPDEIEKKITSRTKAIVPVHYSGQVCDLDRIYAIADKHGLFVSEDAAHALWSRYKGRLIGKMCIRDRRGCNWHTGAYGRCRRRPSGPSH